MSDKKENIDNFVKKVIEHYDVQYDESHWEMLQTRLDAEMPVTGVVPGSGYHVPSIVVSVISGMVLMLGILWVGGAFEERSLNGQVSDTRDIKSLSKSKDQSGVMENYPHPDNTIGSIGNQNLLALSPDPIKRTQNATSETLSSGEMTPIESDEAVAGELSLTSKNLIINAIPTQTDRQMLLHPSISSMEESTSLMDQVAEDKSIVAKRPFRWGVIASFAPDFNSVGMETRKQVSKQFGLQLLTTYKDRITISSGILYNKKRYTTSGETYHPPGGYWIRKTNGIIPEEVFGHCAVLDVPINFTYHWNQGRRLQLLTTVGISNYFVLSEDYHYRFSNPNPGADEGWDTDEKTRVMFGVGNISVGVMYFIKPKISVKVEPYLKLPFKDIGWGQVNLYSTGSLISLQYLIN